MKMQSYEIYKETIPFVLVKWILAIEIATTILFLCLFIYQLTSSPVGDRPAPDLFYFGMFLLFAGSSALIANFRKLNISITSQSIIVAYGRIKYSIPWDRIEDCSVGKDSGTRYGGWGIRLTKAEGATLLVYNVIGSPMVVLELKRGRFGKFIFSSRHPEEVLNIIKQHIG
tara:strand:+ start:185 stop:697 length:513 start_codon:yes stop_codon:yes gene_type:complete